MNRCKCGKPAIIKVETLPDTPIIRYYCLICYGKLTTDKVNEARND